MEFGWGSKDCHSELGDCDGPPMRACLAAMNCWDQVQSEIRARGELTPQQYKHWLQPVRYSHVAPDRTLHVEAPNEIIQGWLETECQSRIMGAIERLGLEIEGYSVSLEPSPEGPAQGQLDFGVGASQFNPKYTFSRFVVGDCNQFAHAASQAVVSNLATAYNPLYVYSEVGMGKTHLLHAIGHAVQVANAGLNVVYTSAEEFMNEMISAIRCNNMADFHQRYRTADMLLVDDIQILGSKERTQEEFFHTFNVLHNRGKQIVLTSDSDPGRVPGLVARLKSRFFWGLLADIQPPDLETKMAILESKASEQQVQLPEDVRGYIAKHLQSNIRELEGLLNRLVARAKFTSKRITLKMVRDIIGDPVPAQPTGKPTIEDVKRGVAGRFGIKSSDLMRKGNSQKIAQPRHVAIYLARELCGLTLVDIGKIFDKHHTTVLHSVRKIRSEMKTSETTRSTVEALMVSLGG